jgi:histidinol phosphatase-like PHP family hydrolase
VKIGYRLSAEEHESREILENAKWAEQAGFSYALISDHSIRGSTKPMSFNSFS